MSAQDPKKAEAEKPKGEQEAQREKEAADAKKAKEELEVKKAAAEKPEALKETCVPQTNEELYSRIKEDFKAIHKREPKVADMLKGLDARIKGSVANVEFNLVSPKKAADLKAEFIEEKVVIQEK